MCDSKWRADIHVPARAAAPRANTEKHPAETCKENKLCVQTQKQTRVLTKNKKYEYFVIIIDSSAVLLVV